MYEDFARTHTHIHTYTYLHDARELILYTKKVKKVYLRDIVKDKMYKKKVHEQKMRIKIFGLI